MNANDRRFMTAAIDASEKSKPDTSGSAPRVGAVATRGDKILAEAYRDFDTGRHAEYILLEQKLPSEPLIDSTVYTTLEPCTERGVTRKGEKKVPCVERLIERRVKRVVIGMLDPNPIVRGLGFRKLRQAGIETDMFPNDLMKRVEDINRDFIRAIEADPVHKITQQIAVLSVKTRGKLQINARDYVLEDCYKNIHRIYQDGQIPIQGGEAGFFKRWIERMDEFPGRESVRAYIRVSPFVPKDLLTKNWFKHFYGRITDFVKQEKLTIRYVFLMRSKKLAKNERAFLDRFKKFAAEIRIVDEGGWQLQAEMLRPSIVLFENQQFAFTHDRGDNMILIEALEHVSPSEFSRLQERFNTIKAVSSEYWTKE